MKNELQNKDALRKICFQLDRADHAYQNYKKFPLYVHALSLKKANKKIIKLLNRHNHVLDPETSNVCLELLVHLDLWYTQFKYEERLQSPRIDAEFRFPPLPGNVFFPSEKIKLLYNAARP
jgi:hypothetical protein